MKKARYLLYYAWNLVRVKCDTGSGPPAFGSGRLTVRLELDGEGLGQDALKIQERHFAKDVAGRGKSNLTVRGVSIIRETLSLSPSLTRPLSLSLSLIGQRGRTACFVCALPVSAKGGLGGVGAMCLCSLPDVDAAVRLLFYLLAVRTESLPKPSPLPKRGEIIDFLLSLPLALLFFGLLKGGGLTFPTLL